MSHAFAGVKNLATKIRHRVASALRSQSGAFDLTSVLVGAAVVAILVGGTAVTTFGIIPWAQNNSATQQLNAISTAQGVHKAQTTNGANYATNLAALQTANLIPADAKNIYVAGDSDSWAALSKSDTGSWYQSTSKAPSPVPIVAAAPADATAAATAVTTLNAAL
jgi:type II secretory pathway pseudopilin PulG